MVTIYKIPKIPIFMPKTTVAQDRTNEVYQANANRKVTMS